ncbi:partitioning defective 3 homolog isoform X3 [Mizuhopecten yessoensis]|uniref:partitioning defective 3 homolog isoform X3 n=1 Tax=Mizuhopecten yessoensis TaxID=6573 RepID=UPI000B45EE3A|nr:partitioning defective 3 homolog isoform X3 [Mizuhopecten yessoensis]
MPMKVTVCFDRVRVIVPCGDGHILVGELISKAILRYKKAIGKSSDHWVTVHNLKTSTDGGILDPDDILNDVVDDREQLLADYEEKGGNGYQPHNGDGASASSAGTASPDIFQPPDQSPSFSRKELQDNRHDIVVTPKDLTTGSGLTVRHGSEPMLNVTEEDQSSESKLTVKPIQVKDEDKPTGILHVKQASLDDGKSKNPFSRFARDSWRQSVGSRPDMYKWLEAQERQQDQYPQMERREPVGSVGMETKEDNSVTQPVIKPALTPLTNEPVEIVLINDGGPLGIHVVPEYNESQKELGLLVQGIEPGGKIFKDGRLRVNDRIININGTSLHGVNFARAQEIFRKAMTTSEIQLLVVKKKPSLPKNPPPVAPKPRSHTPVKPSPLTLPITNKLDLVDQLSPLSPEITSTPTGSVQGNSPDTQDGKSPLSQRTFREPIRSGHYVNPLSPIRKVPPAPPTRSPKTSLSANPEITVSSIKAPTNTKRIGKKIAIELTKGPQGLGFSVTTRDNPAGGDSPIYIKNILPKGAAITDGRLKAGDRLLEVNGEDMTGKTQSEAVARLKSCDPGSLVQIVVSRQELEQDERFRVPRKLDNEKENQKQNVLQPAEKSGDDGTLVGMRNKEVLTLDIPLKESGSAGLGVSVKGKTQTTEHGQRDLGIFIKAVIHGGAASKDGRLIINDQLLEVNGDVLHGLSNTEAMETLRNSMQKDGPLLGYIHLVIARRIGAPSPSPYQEYSTDYMLFDEQRTSGDDSQESKVETESDRTSGAKGSNSKESNNNIKDYIDGAKARNSALERLMSGGNGLRNDSYTRATSEQDVEGVGLRNESYTRATNDSANMFLPGMSPAANHQRSAPTLRSRGTEAVMIEDDPGSKKQNYDMKMRPHSTLGILRGSPPHSNSSSSEDLREQPPSWLRGPDWNRHPSAPGDRHPSTTSEEPMSPLVTEPFARDAMGRQSMSEKRRGHQDPRGSEYYQRAKTLRDSQKGQGHQRRAPGMVRVGSAESLISRSKPNIPPLQLYGNTGPAQKSTSSSNLKRCSSLENLTMAGPGDQDDSGEIADSDEDDPSQEEDTPVVPRSMMARGRGTNDSFRAAVDRSYDPVEHSTMETREGMYSNSEGHPHDGGHTLLSLQGSMGFTYSGYVEEESSGEISGRTNSARSSVSSDATSDDKKGGRRKNKDKKGGNIFKGIFRLGRNKKSAEENAKTEVDKQEEEAERHFISRDMGNNRQHDADGNMGQRWTSVPDTHQSYPVSLPQQPSSTSLDSDNHIIRGATPNNMSRAEWIQHLRAEHQRKHKERQGRYPLDDREEGYERELQETEEQLVPPMYRQYRPNSRQAAEGYKYDDQPRSTSSEGYMYEGQGHPRSRPSSRQQYERPPPQPHSYTDYMYQSAPPNVSYQPPAPWPHPGQDNPHLQHNYPHVRQNSDSYSDRDQFPRQPPSRSHTPIEQWHDNHLSYHRKPLYTSAEVHPTDSNYGYNDAVYTYREPVYPPVAGKRQVHTITQPGSAKV